MVSYEKMGISYGIIKTRFETGQHKRAKKNRMEIEGFYKEVLEQLIKNEVEFLLVGGLAVGFHGYARFTGDMDLWLKPSNDNLERLGNALGDLNYSKKIVDDIIESRPIDHPTPIRIFSEDDKFKVDLMTSIFYEPLTFEKCYERAKVQKLESFNLPIISLKDLIEIKSNVKRYDGSLKDVVDAQELRKILERGEAKTINKQQSLFKRIFKKKGNDKGISM